MYIDFFFRGNNTEAWIRNTELIVKYNLMKPSWVYYMHRVCPIDDSLSSLTNPILIDIVTSIAHHPCPPVGPNPPMPPNPPPDLELGASQKPTMHHNDDVTNSFPGYLAVDRVFFLVQNDSYNSNQEKILQYGKGLRVFYHIIKFYF